ARHILCRTLQGERREISSLFEAVHVGRDVQLAGAHSQRVERILGQGADLGGSATDAGLGAAADVVYHHRGTRADAGATNADGPCDYIDAVLAVRIHADIVLGNDIGTASNGSQ